MYDDELSKMVKSALNTLANSSNASEQSPMLYKSTGYLESDEKPMSEQAAEFKKILDDLFELHIKKTSDYSSWNIKGAGEQGVVVRLWDKTARLMNLMGWDIGTGKWTTPKQPKNESVDDTLYDLASYAIIMLVLRRGKWGKE
jgi:hypothetical protein